MKILFTLALACASLTSMAQKVNVDDGKILVDGKNYGTIDRDGCGFAYSVCEFNVKDTSGKKEIIIKYFTFNDPTERQASNPKGTVDYFQFIFVETKQTAEVQANFIKTEKMAKYIIKNELINGGGLNKEAVDLFVLANGNNYTKRKINM